MVTGRPYLVRMRTDGDRCALSISDLNNPAAAVGAVTLPGCI